MGTIASQRALEYVLLNKMSYSVVFGTQTTTKLLRFAPVLDCHHQGGVERFSFAARGDFTQSNGV